MTTVQFAFGEGFALSVPVNQNADADVKDSVSKCSFPLACYRIPGFSAEVGSLTSFLLNVALCE